MIFINSNLNLMTIEEEENVGLEMMRCLGETEKKMMKMVQLRISMIGTSFYRMENVKKSHSGFEKNKS